MNLSRALSTLLSSSRKCVQLRRIPAAYFQLSAFSSNGRRTAKLTSSEEEIAFPIKSLKKPTEIPFQPRAANTVQLVGRIGVPVQQQTLPDGRIAAVSVLVQESNEGYPHFWIPIIFQGDLAQVASAYLEEHSLVCITGQLSGDLPPFKIKDGQANIQILAHGLNFVGGEVAEKADDTVEAKGEENNFPDHELWNDLLLNPNKWWDNRSNKKFPNAPDFKHKETGKFLWINDLIPDSIRFQLDTLSFGPTRTNFVPKGGSQNKAGNAKLAQWEELVANPHEWVDNRMDKESGLKTPKFPDFSNLVNKDGLWINTAPDWIVAKLDGLTFAERSSFKKPESAFNVNQAGTFQKNDFWKNKKNSFVASEKKAKNDDLWKDLVANPSKWWDNRVGKRNLKAPDFKHKDSGEGLWMNDAPEWAKSSLPPEKTGMKDQNREAYNSPGDIPQKSFRTTLLS